MRDASGWLVLSGPRPGGPANPLGVRAPMQAELVHGPQSPATLPISKQQVLVVVNLKTAKQSGSPFLQNVLRWPRSYR